MIECKICGKECKSYISLTMHILKLHNILIENYYLKYIGKQGYCECGKSTKFITITTGFHKFCSKKCSANSKETRNKYKTSCLDKFGYDNPSKNKKIKYNKIKTCLKNHGTKYPSQDKKVKEKTKQTCIKIYGTNHPLQNKKILNKLKETNLKKQGVEFSFQNINTIEKIQEQKRISYYNNFFTSYKFKNKIIPLFNLEEYLGTYNSKINKPIYYLWKCTKCGNIFEDHLHSHIPTCLNCYPLLFEGISNLEKEIRKEINKFLIKKFNKQFKVRFNDRTILKPYEIDILIPELNLSIEVNGDYWHSFKETKERDKWKCETLIEKGYKHFIIKEREWNKNKNLILEKFNNLLEIDYEKYLESKSYFLEVYI